MRQINLKIRITFFCVFFSFSSILNAALEISPQRIYLSSQKNMSSFSIKNSAFQPIKLKLSVTRLNKNDRALRNKTENIIILPTIINIAPKQTQTVYLELHKSLSNIKKESEYKLNVQEISSSATYIPQDIKITVQKNMPFLNTSISEQILQNHLEWSAKKTIRGTIKLTLENQSNTQLEVSQLTISIPGKSKPLAKQQKYAHILPSHRYVWLIHLTKKLGKTVKQIHLVANTNWGNIKKDITLSLA